MALEGDETMICPPPVDAAPLLRSLREIIVVCLRQKIWVSSLNTSARQEYHGTNGVLSQASYDELSEDGYTKKRVDWAFNTNQGDSSWWSISGAIYGKH